ncbi:hypothetical protein [Novosphingobium soli]|uniref:Uncharacterized protein n=1 Tax=Novosphingobium soli TaxID=574956 RepID=A0ABV6CZ37_9SPHN
MHAGSIPARASKILFGESRRQLEKTLISDKWNPDGIERAWAHMVAGSVRRIYNLSAYGARRSGST